MVAEREGYEIQIVKGDMSKALPFGQEVFDIIFNPVSVCFVREVEQVWQECFRVLKPGGILMSGFGNPMEMSLDENDQIKRKLPYDPIANSTDAELEVLSRNDGILFSHSLDTLVGGQARANLCLTDLYEDYHFGSTLVPTYIATRAMKKLW